MKRYALYPILLLVLTCITLFSCSDNDNGEKEFTQTEVKNPALNATEKLLSIKSVRSDAMLNSANVSSESLKAFVNGQYDLNFDLLRNASSQLNPNAMISTTSIQTALAMAWAGAKGNNADEIRNALNLADDAHNVINYINSIILAEDPTSSSEINLINNLYLQPGFEWDSAWLNKLAQNYDTGITEINFENDTEAARSYINQSVSDATHGHIQNIISSNGITKDTSLVITSAVYFKSRWSGEFSKYGKKSFIKMDQSKVDVDYITQSADFDYLETDQYKAVSVGMKKGFQMMFILPEEGEFNSVQAGLSGDEIRSILKQMESNAEINLIIPAFSFKTVYPLSATLQKMGMRSAFYNGDFNGMTENVNNIYISNIYHMTDISLDENGIDASAASGVVGDKSGDALYEHKTIDLTLDRPFFYVIYETSTKSPLFVGRMMDPTQN